MTLVGSRLRKQSCHFGDFPPLTSFNLDHGEHLMRHSHRVQGESNVMEKVNRNYD
jgi:hypothetical protein